MGAGSDEGASSAELAATLDAIIAELGALVAALRATDHLPAWRTAMRLALTLATLQAAPDLGER